MKWKLTISFLMVMGVSFFNWAPTTEAKPDLTKDHILLFQGEKTALLQLIRKWEAKYNVLFTYDCPDFGYMPVRGMGYSIHYTITKSGKRRYPGLCPSLDGQ